MSTELSIVPTTELEVVNEMLGAIGEFPVNTISGIVTTDVSIAKRIFGLVNRAVQAKGWHFNSDYNVTLSLDSNDEIILGQSILSVGSPTRDITVRGGKLYDRVTRGTTFTSAITDAWTITLLEFQDLPQLARSYITEACKRQMEQEVLGEVSADVRNKESELRAWADLVDDEANRSNVNFGNGTYDMFNTTHKNRLVQ